MAKILCQEYYKTAKTSLIVVPIIVLIYTAYLKVGFESSIANIVYQNY